MKNVNVNVGYQLRKICEGFILQLPSQIGEFMSARRRLSAFWRTYAI